MRCDAMQCDATRCDAMRCSPAKRVLRVREDTVRQKVAAPPGAVVFKYHYFAILIFGSDRRDVSSVLGVPLTVMRMGALSARLFSRPRGKRAPLKPKSKRSRPTTQPGFFCFFLASEALVSRCVSSCSALHSFTCKSGSSNVSERASLVLPPRCLGWRDTWSSGEMAE